jgi:hypothetical protein
VCVCVCVCVCDAYDFDVVTNYPLPTTHSTRSRHAKGLATYAKTGRGPVLGKRVELVACNKDCKEFPIEIAIINTGTTMCRVYYLLKWSACVGK